MKLTIILIVAAIAQAAPIVSVQPAEISPGNPYVSVSVDFSSSSGLSYVFDGFELCKTASGNCEPSDIASFGQWLLPGWFSVSDSTPISITVGYVSCSGKGQKNDYVRFAMQKPSPGVQLAGVSEITKPITVRSADLNAPE